MLVNYCFNTNPGSQTTYHDDHMIPFPFEENELELRNVKFWRLKKCENFTNRTIFNLFERVH